MLHENINVMDALKLDANHMIVVYRRLKDSTVQRRIIQGPTVFVPEAEEWFVIAKFTSDYIFIT